MRGTPNILLNTNGAGQLAAGRINWQTDGSFRAGILDIPSTDDLVIVHGDEEGEGVGDIVITNKRIEHVVANNLTLGEQTQYHKQLGWQDPDFRITQPTDLVRIERTFVDRLGALTKYSTRVRLTINCQALAEPTPFPIQAQLYFKGYFEATVKDKFHMRRDLDEIYMFHGRDSQNNFLPSIGPELGPGSGPQQFHFAEYEFEPEIADIDDGDVLTMRVVATELLMWVHSDREMQDSQSVSGLFLQMSASGGANRVQQTIIGSDGILIRQDNSSALKLYRDTNNNQIRLQWTGYPTSSTGLNTGDLWVDKTAGNVIKIKQQWD